MPEIKYLKNRAPTELDQPLFQLNDEDFDAFEEALSAPISENTKLKTLLQEPAPWEK